MSSRQEKARAAKARAQKIEFGKTTSYKNLLDPKPDVQEMLFLAHNWFGNVRKIHPMKTGKFTQLGSGVKMR